MPTLKEYILLDEQKSKRLKQNIKKNNSNKEINHYNQKTKQLRINLGFEAKGKKQKFNPYWKEQIKKFDDKYTAKPIYRRSSSEY